jgi:type II secretory pathway pseudopilin PulG
MRKNGYALLLELLIACAIILILAGAAVPNLVRVAQVQNTNNVLAVLNAINLAQGQFAQAYPGEGYAAQVGWLANSQRNQIGMICPSLTCQCPNLLAPAYASIFSGAGMTGTFSGYILTFSPGSTSPYINEQCNIWGMPKGVMGYTLTAIPQNSTAGTYFFYSDNSGVIRWSQGSPANIMSPVW